MVYLTIPIVVDDHLIIQVGWQLQQLPYEMVLYDIDNNVVQLEDLRINTPQGIITPTSVDQVINTRPNDVLDKHEDGYDRYLSKTVNVRRLVIDVLRLWLYDLIIAGIGDEYVYPPDIAATNPAYKVYNVSKIDDLVPNMDTVEYLVRTYSQHIIVIEAGEGNVCALVKVLDHHVVVEQENKNDCDN